jgi:DNA polymerase-3 subunit gamma/tau
MLSKSAFNALLKIMEEPPCYPGTKESYIIFILATTELHKVPETIASRCQVFNFKQMTNEQVVEQLQMIADRECITTTQE